MVYEQGRYMSFEKILPESIERVDLKTLKPIL